MFVEIESVENGFKVRVFSENPILQGARHVTAKVEYVFNDASKMALFLGEELKTLEELSEDTVSNPVRDSISRDVLKS
jgi:hypothetical protein